MNFFVGIGNAIAGFFKSDAFKYIFNTGKSILKAVIGEFGPKLQQIALEEVTKAQVSGGSAEDKFKMAYDAIIKRVNADNIGESAINLAIELAVAAMKKGKS